MQEKENVLDISLQNENDKNYEEELFTGLPETLSYEQHINMQRNENIPNISLINNTGKKCEKEIQVTTNQNIPINLLEPKIILIKLTRQNCKKYIKNSQQPLAFIENTISSKELSILRYYMENQMVL
ncbi:uncharacterized protein LOC116848386 [Odontomachus brunneus]|uniref:uncharacterized protein LOC116848386 n=1 Tax=Odontomachus brunneus TaxID=486640 RepID=UPI0013F1C053|nr:uncharacterized protein LOC116848386 [Odontomachus brunneus]